MQNITIVTYIPSPYQVELFNAIALSGKFNLQVVYLQSNCNIPVARHWQQPEIQHDHVILGDGSQQQRVKQYIDSCDLVVFNYYRHPLITRLIDRRIALDLPWCFWGERPGFKYPKLLGKIYRRWKLARLHQRSVPIWGVGIWGIDGYRSEFGDRQYFNLPYFSNLSRFATSTRNFEREKRVFLYSGALSERKGVDLLADTFGRLVDRFEQIELHILGEGELRLNLEHKLARYPQQVKFFGFQPWDKLPHYYQQADILCVPSLYDGWGLVVPEGLAAGLPVIATDRTGAAIELIRDGVNGWLVDANNGRSLSEAMEKAIALSPQELANYSQAASDRALKHSLTHGVQRFERAATETIEQFYATQYEGSARYSLP